MRFGNRSLRRKLRKKRNKVSRKGDAEHMYRRALEIINEELRNGKSGSVREEQARGAMVVLGHLIGQREMNELERNKWLPACSGNYNCTCWYCTGKPKPWRKLWRRCTRVFRGKGTKVPLVFSKKTAPRIVRLTKRVLSWL